MGLEVQAAPEGLIRLEHTEIHLDKPTYCAWGLKNPGRCVAGVGNKRKFGAVKVINRSFSTKYLNCFLCLYVTEPDCAVVRCRGEELAVR
jgi:hypothetical protein